MTLRYAHLAPENKLQAVKLLDSLHSEQTGWFIEAEKPGTAIIKVPDGDLSRGIDQAIGEVSAAGGTQLMIELLIDGPTVVNEMKVIIYIIYYTSYIIRNIIYYLFSHDSRWIPRD
jgi:hypothetical protein